MSVAALRKICDERKIWKIAIVDDVFDVPDPQLVDRDQYAECRREYNLNQVLKNAVARVSGTRIDRLPRFDDLRDEELGALWKCVWKTRLAGRRLRADHMDVLCALFERHGADVLGMLDTVVELFLLLRRDLGRLVAVYGSDGNPDRIAKAQIVVLDYFLGRNLTKQQALEKASNVVMDVVKVARSANGTIPSFLLVSSRPQEIDVEAFRKGAKLMKSRFRFFAKEALRADQIDNMVNLHDLVDASDRTEKIERLIEDWQEGATRAVSAVRERMLTLDVSDLVYLDCFRLTHEGTSISNYLRWFLTASLSASITSRLKKSIWCDSNTPRLFNVVGEVGRLDPTTLVKTFDGPSTTIGHAYSDILFDESRGTGGRAFPAQLSGSDLVEGDLFVAPGDGNRRGYEGAEVWLVMTPSCDLRPRAPNQPPAAQSVLLLPGTLKRLAREEKGSNITEIDFIRVPGFERRHIFQIVWNFSRPISIDYSKMCADGPGELFRRLGRIRDLYFHRVRDEFANRLTRIGTEVAPLFPHPRSGKVLIAVENKGKRSFRAVMPFSSTNRFVWEIGPVRTTGQAGKSDYVYQASRKFIEKLTNVLGRRRRDPSLAAAAERGSGHLKKLRTYMDLLKPKAHGARGEGGVVEFRRAMKRSDFNPKNMKSNADLLIVTFID